MCKIQSYCIVYIKYDYFKQMYTLCIHIGKFKKTPKGINMYLYFASYLFYVLPNKFVKHFCK